MGTVYLVGSGPGDEDLLTVRGRKILEKADIIFYDRLANDQLLSWASEEAEQVYVGKKSGQHSYQQSEINDLLVEYGQQDKTVVRLKGGDPFVFGRGGEEARQLTEADVEFEVVPGVTSPLAAPAYAGIPVTHRDFSSSVGFVTGHPAATKETSSVNWKQLAQGVETLVILMGVENIDKITSKLLQAGREPDTPVALVRWGTKSQQEVLTGKLDNIDRKVKMADFQPPAVIIIGEVVNLRNKLNWFEEKALFNKDIVVTRPPGQAASFSRLLSRAGANPITAPAIEIKPPSSYCPLDEKLNRIETYDWMIFTSVNGVQYTLDRLFEIDRDVRSLGGVKLGAIGTKTAGRLEEYGLKADYVPEDYVSEAIIEGFSSQDLTGCRFLLPRANIARPKLQRGLEDLGAEVDYVVAYRTVAGSGHQEVEEKLAAGGIDVVTFTSSSTVRNFLSMLEGEPDSLLNKTKVACIGPITAKTAREEGLAVEIVADEYTIEGLGKAIKEYYS